MKKIFALLLITAVASQPSWGQQVTGGPTPAAVSTVPPRRYSATEMSRFRSLQAASAESTGDPQRQTLGSTLRERLAALSSRKKDPPAASQSVLNTGSNQRPTGADPQLPPAEPQEIAVPPILAMGQSMTTKSASQPSVLPEELSMNAPPAARNSTGESQQATAARPDSRGSIHTSSGPIPGATKTPPNWISGAPVNAASNSPVSFPNAVGAGVAPGKVIPVSAQQDVAEPLQGGSFSVQRTLTLTDEDDSGAVDGLKSAPSINPIPASSESPLRSTVSGTPFSSAPAPAQRGRMVGSDSLTMINSPGAAIGVSTTGPKTIAIGKIANYGVTVVNSGQSDAHQLEVTFSVPSWIEIANTNVSAGGKELVRENDDTRIVWRLDRLEAGQSQLLTLDVVPRRAQVFDFNVEWSVAPLTGAAQIQVTEPMLKMAISGPDEVQFGQSAVYSLVIRNPGTGTAENVNLMLSEALGGERAPLGDLKPGEEKNIQVELIARNAGALDLSASVSGEGDLQDNALKKITVRRAQLEIAIQGPSRKYAGSTANYQVSVENKGDAVAQNVFAAIGLPTGTQYLSGIEGAERIEGGMRWSVGVLPPGAQRTYTIACQLTSAGPLQIETGVRGDGDLADAAVVQTLVETEADLVLSVDDPQGPIPIEQDVTYQLTVKNRGTKAANGIDVVMHFSNGIEPTAVEGEENTINPGEVAFQTIDQLGPGEERIFSVTARATVAGTHEFRAQLTCSEAEAREVAGGTTKFFGDNTLEEDSLNPPMQLGSQSAENEIR